MECPSVAQRDPSESDAQIVDPKDALLGQKQAFGTADFATGDAMVSAAAVEAGHIGG